METNILGIRISIFLDCIFWRDFGFWTQEGFGEECGQVSNIFKSTKMSKIITTDLII